MPVNRLFFSAGEVSGDIHAARLIKALKERLPQGEVVGLGGRFMALEGMELIDGDVSLFSTVGLTDSLRFYERKKKSYERATAYLNSHPVDGVVLVDNQGFNIPLARFCYEKGIPCVYYMPPHVSIWGRWNAPKLMEWCKHLFVSFPEDAKVYREYGNHVDYYGHPLAEEIRLFLAQSGHPEQKTVMIGLFPGSRYQEIENLLSEMLLAVKNMPQEWRVCLALSHPDYEQMIREQVVNHGLTKRVEFSYDARAVLFQSTVVVASSGTITLEAALFRKPVILGYRISPLSYLIGHLLLKEKLIGMPNILLHQKLFPELLQKDWNHRNILKWIEFFLSLSDEEKKRYDEAYDALWRLLLVEGGHDKLASHILSVFGLWDESSPSM
ncbi:lipid-A-disaccharide synthase [Thermospira aquatica]|uniref:Lipid-A-disaccharide synthase n=1 Tax=Thermospira aquatica TaxID=2828656 RepID=A0AAX3BG04_9SPIR|nr:lipid-A-disaccharide synthase [Thermospira aquatica]URA11205.1 lipid-A-disaccharide synthase [Thermospira aquatica]